MKEEYYLINKKVLPSYFSQIIKVNKLVDEGMTITEACKKAKLSRSTYYKYKGFVFSYNEEIKKKMLISIKYQVSNNIMSELIKIFKSFDIEIISFIKNDTVNGFNFLLITFNISIEFNIAELIYSINQIADVIETSILAIE